MGWLFQMFLFAMLVAPLASQLDPEVEDTHRLKYTFEFRCSQRHFRFSCILKVDEALLSDPKTANGFDMFKQIIKSPKLNPAEWGDKIVRPYVDIIHNCGPNNTDTLQRQQDYLEDCILEQTCGFSKDIKLG